MSPLPNAQMEVLADRIGSEVFLDVAGWHLYLRDIRRIPLAKHVAEAVVPRMTARGLAINELNQILAGIPVSLGGGQTQVPLSDCIPKANVDHLAQVLEQYAREWLD
ncbi:MAG: DUF3181 family protein [Synechococcales cyanobacterium]